MHHTVPFPHTLWGALLGNPEDDKPSRDGCPDFQSNEVRTHINLDERA